MSADALAIATAATTHSGTVSTPASTRYFWTFVTELDPRPNPTTASAGTGRIEASSTRMEGIGTNVTGPVDRRPTSTGDPPPLDSVTAIGRDLHTDASPAVCPQPQRLAHDRRIGTYRLPRRFDARLRPPSTYSPRSSVVRHGLGSGTSGTSPRTKCSGHHDEPSSCDRSCSRPPSC